jgi:hypothetical protein
MQSEHAMITWNCKEPDQRLRASFGTLGCLKTRTHYDEATAWSQHAHTHAA